MIMSPFILKLKLTMPLAANFAIRTPRNLRKSSRISHFTTMKAEIIQEISRNQMEEEKSVRNNEVVGKNVVEPNKSDIAKPPEEVDRKDEVENRTNDETVRIPRETSWSKKLEN
ncbi:hypothetical protein Tco_1152872 [Tanacetum coccineum]